MSWRVSGGVRATAIVALLLLAICGHVSSGAQKEEQRASLPKELTPGQVALLGNSLDALRLEQLRGAVTASDPIVRAVAARVVGVSKSRTLAEAVAAAWAQEQHVSAAAEQARALLLLRGGLASDSIEERLASPAILKVYAEWTARHQAERMVDVLTKTAATATKAGDSLNEFVWMAMANRPDLADRMIGARLRTATPPQWRTFIDRLTLDGTNPAQDTALAQALTFDNEAIREGTVWSVVVRVANGHAVPVTLLDGIAGPVNATTGSAPVTWEQFGREIVARRHRQQQTPDRSALVTAEAATHQSDSVALARLDELLETERNALKKALGSNYPPDVKTSTPAPAQVPPEPVRTVPTLWPGLLKSAMDAAQCRGGKGSMPLGIAAVTYRADGTIASISLSTDPLPRGCDEVLTAMVRLTAADVTYSPVTGKREMLILPLGTDAVECATQPSSGTTPDVRADSKIVKPKKTRDLQPIYPAGANQRRVQGTVVVEATISSTGCISELKLAKRVDPELDIAALIAVSGWRFSPATLDGAPIPVVMTITINFRLP